MESDRKNTNFENITAEQPNNITTLYHQIEDGKFEGTKKYARNIVDNEVEHCYQGEVSIKFEGGTIILSGEINISSTDSGVSQERPHHHRMSIKIDELIFNENDVLSFKYSKSIAGQVIIQVNFNTPYLHKTLFENKFTYGLQDNDSNAILTFFEVNQVLGSILNLLYDQSRENHKKQTKNGSRQNKL